MDFRLADTDDLPQLIEVYTKIIDHMNQNGMGFWDAVYPCLFFEEDIKNHRLYILLEQQEIISAFALSETNSGECFVNWRNKHDKVLYIDRFGVNVDYLRKGIGSDMLHNALSLAKELNASCLRLFVVDINKPAINLYTKNGFEQAEGIYHAVIDDELILHEFGYEIKV